MLHHARVLLGVLQVFLTKEYLAIAMEYAAGGDMFQYVKHRGGLEEVEARWFFQQLIIGMDYCHKMVRPSWAAAKFASSLCNEGVVSGLAGHDIESWQDRETWHSRLLVHVLCLSGFVVSFVKCGVLMGVCHDAVQGVVNRDIKLENTLLDGSKRPLLKICDFGYSKNDKDSVPKSKVGTPGYTGGSRSLQTLNVSGLCVLSRTHQTTSCNISIAMALRLSQGTK